MSVFETLRDLVSVEQVTGGRVGEKILCLAHDDVNTPNLHLYDDHVYCYACGFHGDVVALWQMMHGFDRPIEAALDLARKYGVELPEQSPEARKKAQERRDREERYLDQAKVCHRALDTHPNVREWWEKRGFGEELQREYLLGANRDGTEAVIPFWSRGRRVKGLIRRKLEGEPKYANPSRKEFPDGHKPLFIPGPLRDDVLLVEGIVDSLALAALGESTAAVAGTNISAEQTSELEKLSGPIYVLPDANPRGDEAARRWVRSFYPKAFLCPAEYGEGREDVAALFAGEGQGASERLIDLKAAAVDALYLELAEAPEGSNNLGAYRAAKERILPLLLKLDDEGEQDAVLRDVAKKLKLPIKPLQKALAETIELSRQAAEEKAAMEAENAAPKPGSERHELAMALLKDRRLLSKAAVDMKKLGHVGEFRAKKLGFVCAASPRSGSSIQPATHAQSSAGKNYLWDTVLSLYPPEMVIKRTGLSAKALFRTQVDLRGKVLYIQEVAGSEDADYTIRVMQSDGMLEYEATEKMPDGSLGNVVYRTEGPTTIVQTTTRNHLHPENATRVFPIFIDESDEQTGRIVDSILNEASGNKLSEEEQQRIRQRWHDAIRLLEPAEVVIPYAKRIEIPRSPLRIRRDARRLIDVVRVIAWLHQYQRDRDAQGRILATEEDFNEALELVSESLRRAWQTLTPSEEKVLEAIRHLPEAHRKRNGFKRSDLKVKGLSDRSIKDALKSLTDTGYLDCDGRKGPQGYTYTLVRDAKKISLGISLRPLPDNGENPANSDNPYGREHAARYRPMPESSAEECDQREAGATGRNDHRPTKDADLQGKPATGRTGGAEDEKGTSTNAYKEHQLSYVVEGLRELFDSHPEAREDEPEKLAHDLYLWCDFDREPPVEVVEEALKHID